MSKRELRSAGSTTAQTLDKTKNYKLNTSGTLVESTGTPGGTEIVFSGSKSSLRRIADLERNVSILAAKALSDDGTGSGEAGDVDYAKRAGKWTTARTITLGGDLSGSVSIDGSANVTLNATVGSNTVILGTDTTGNYMANVTAGTGISVSHTQGEGSTATISLSASTSNVSEGTNLYFTDARARGALSASGAGVSYSSATGVISYVDPTTSNVSEGTRLYYTDARARAAVSAGTGISYNSGTGVITNTITQYTDALARGAVSAGTGISYNSGTGVITNTITQYTDAMARASNSFVAGSGAYNSTTGVITIPTNTNQLTNGAGFITGYTETSTLDAVVARGSSTSRAMSTGALTVGGAITATGEITAYYSDLRLKTNIVTIADALDKVEAINGVTFDPNEAALALGIDARHQMGVIAQEVEAVAPELVTDSAFKGYKTVRYDKLTALLIEAVKELSAKVKTLEAQLGTTKPTL